KGPPQRILFLKLTEQGATVLACDALRVAAERVGAENVYFCVFAENRWVLDVLELLPAANVLPIRSDRCPWFVIGVLRLLRRVRPIQCAFAQGSAGAHSGPARFRALQRRARAGAREGRGGGRLAAARSLGAAQCESR